MTEFLILVAVLFALSVIDNYIGKSENNRDYTSKPKKHTRAEPVADWKLYTGTLMYMPAYLKQQYLQSEEWKWLKALRQIIAEDTCEAEGCTVTEGLHLHHITYERLTKEHIDDVVLLCPKHHKAKHDKLGYDRETKYPIA